MTDADWCMTAEAEAADPLHSPERRGPLERMLDRFTPTARARSVWEIHPDVLADCRIRGLMLDLDNTVLAWRSPEITEQVREWLGQVQSAGIRACLVSNASRRRLARHAERLGIPGFHSARKPFRRALRKAIRMLGLEPQEVVMVGDQLFTDVLAANRLGIPSVLVLPLSVETEPRWMRFVRRLENRILRSLHIPRFRDLAAPSAA